MIAPIPMATMVNREWGSMGQNYLRSLLALAFQAFLIIVCVGIYAVLVKNIAMGTDIMNAIWTCMGYTVLLCFTLFKTGSLAKSIFNGSEFDTIIIFELKRPMRDDYTDSENPITQLYDYVIKIREGRAKNKYHRPIRAGANTKFYLYAICDVTDKLQRLIFQHGFTPTPDKMGYFRFNDSLNSYMEILSYNKILNDAKKRNRILFQKLGI